MFDPNILSQAAHREKSARVEMENAIRHFAITETIWQHDPTWKNGRRRRTCAIKRYKRLRLAHEIALGDLEQAGADISNLSRFEP